MYDTNLGVWEMAGFIFLMMITAHWISPKPYFTPYAIQMVPFWILGAIVGYCGRQLYLNYKNR